MAGTDHAPPPFFKRGPAPLALLTFYLALSLALFVIDLRLQSLDLLRQSVALVTDPIQRIAQTPGSLVDNAAAYLRGLHDLLDENARLKQAQLRLAPDLARLEHLASENERLRKLLSVKEREKASGEVARIMYTARDPFTHRIIIDKGQQSGIVAGQPAIDEAGVVGQVTRVFPFSAEITLITDKDQTVPVQVVRSGQRSVVFGLGGGQLELRYLPANADIKEGDLLVTSGLDGIYLPGFPVARVVSIERENSYAFARIRCAPIAAVENFGEVLVLSPRQPQAPRPPDSPGRSGNTGAPSKPGDK
ncbi:rod shape-determining protein MreC [Azonexus fungiphilus]|jgi:rod shape-determining protein MreC|uniref:Cell shape-determining protein MreC n=1 Tax=Azonexus fungiphilus TaxID=146940 RepID=A0A495WBK7_9RHOO|nr:rod shape-determining protein MreC [Azonexus fungiphilus]NHC06568.1 rod shape-determining protein MreC [Azonexus fungiphilus]RKT58540.1 rod shape-determining protein MreC [Azonexus fungiphilus]